MTKIMKTALNVSKDGKIPEITIQGFIGNSWFFEGISDTGIQDALDSLAEHQEINVVINSNGGDVFQGIAIGNLLKAHSAKINIIINGIAASAASIVAMAGDTVKMYPNAQLMVHKAWTYEEGNAKALKKAAERLDKIDESVITSYEKRFNGTRDELNKLLDNETFMTAEEAIGYGLADSIVEVTEEDDTTKLVKDVLAERKNKMLAFTNVLENTFK